MKSKKKNPFTLLELMICLMLMGLISSLLGIKVYDFIADHRFRSSIEDLFTDIKQLQILALSHNCDMEVKVFKKNNLYYYQCSSDAPLKKGPLFMKHPLKGVVSLSRSEKPVTSLSFQIYSSGRIEPKALIGFHPKESKASEFSIWFDFTRPLLLSIGEKPTPKIEDTLPVVPH